MIVDGKVAEALREEVADAGAIANIEAASEKATDANATDRPSGDRTTDPAYKCDSPELIKRELK